MSLVQIDKQTIVKLPQICAPRSELMKTFDKAAQTQYIHVHAPAGYGKTISTLLWLNKNRGKTIWISLDSYDNALVLFYRLFCMSLLSVIPHDEESLQKVKSLSFNSDPVGTTIELITLLDYGEERYSLVLDDFHLITNEEIKKSLLYVMKRLPISMTVIVLSRNNPSQSFSALLEQQKLSCIDSKDLAFSIDEIKKHFAEYGRFITKEEAGNIHTYTEGWVIALNAMTVSGQIDVSGNSPFKSFHDYMEKTIWDKLGGATREFLLKTSVPDKFTLELCQHITEDPQCEETLNTLIGGNINITMVGSEYRYHNLFIEFLRGRAEQNGPDRQILNKKVADFYLKKGDFLTAKSYAMKSGDPSVISMVVRSFHSLKIFSLDEYVEIHKLYAMDMIPEPICERVPLLYIPRIFHAYTLGNADNVSCYFDKLYPRLPQIAETHPEVVEHANCMVMLDCRIKLSDLPLWFDRLPKITHQHTEPQSPTFTFQLPFLHRCVRDFYELTDERLLARITDFSSNIIKQNLAIMFRGAEAGLLMEQNKISEALDITVYLQNSIDESMGVEFVYAVHMLAAELYFLLRKKEKYEATMKLIKEYITAHACQYLLKNVLAYESRGLIFNGDKAAAERWLKNYFIDDSFDALYKIFRNFTTVRAFILLGQTDKAVDALSRLKALSQRYDRPLDAAEADVLLSIIEWYAGKKKEARNRLQKVLSFLYQYGFIRIVANEGKAVQPILSAILKSLEAGNNPNDGFYKFVKEVYCATYDRAKYLRGITYNSENSISIQLSPQQKRVLILLSKGYKNTEIVNVTGLSLNTIRTHTKLAYQKLEVNNSLDAVSRAKELGMIES
jgi:LuxR family transcriptional regulator, maltose regulon positive regulatory protein